MLWVPIVTFRCVEHYRLQLDSFKSNVSVMHELDRYTLYISEHLSLSIDVLTSLKREILKYQQREPMSPTATS